jgi:2,3-bisphosphoglycerate-dependent phosphoglycerate mutase
MSSTPTTIVLVRHGQTDWNLQLRFQGHINTPLNAAGLVQASALAERLESWPIQAVYSSDLDRAAQTAAPLAQRLGLELVIDPRLRERSGGVFEGLTNEEMLARYADEWQELQLAGSAPPGGESNAQMTKRVLDSFNGIVSQHQGQMVAIVTHGGVIRIILLHLLGIRQEHHRRIDVSGNTGTSIVEIDEHGPRLLSLNDTRHLADDDKWRPVSPWQ